MSAGRSVELRPGRYAVCSAERLTVPEGLARPTFANASGFESGTRRDTRSIRHGGNRRWNRSGNEQHLCFADARRRSPGARQRLRRTHLCERRAFSRGWQRRGRQLRQGEGHPLACRNRQLRQAPDRPLLLLRGSQESAGGLRLRNRRGSEPRCAHRDSPGRILPARNFGDGPARDEADRRASHGREGHQGRHHSPGLLQ